MRGACERYERLLAQGLGVDHAVAFGYSRHALTSILAAAGVCRNDEVVLSPLTCKVVPLALLSMGIRPIYADISAATLNLDSATTAMSITPATRAVVFQHTYGNLAGVAAVEEVARQAAVLLVEDCAQCLPVRMDDYAPGRRGLAAIFSNNLMKPLAAGSGGLAATNDASLASRLRAYQASYPRRSAASEWLRVAEVLAHRVLLRPTLYWPLFELHRTCTSTYQSRPLAEEIASEITKTCCQISERQADDGEQALKRLDAVVAHRRAACISYSEALQPLGAFGLPCATSPFPLYYFPVLVSRKDSLLRAARRENVPIVAWPIGTPIYPIEDERVLRAYGYEPGSCPVAEDVARRLVGLPTDPSMTPRHVEKVIALVKSHDARTSCD